MMCMAQLGPTLVGSASGLSGNILNTLQERLTDEEFNQFLEELKESWQKFQNDAKKQGERYKWAILCAKKAILLSDQFAEDEKIELFTLLDVQSHGPSLLYAFFSNVNLPVLIALIVMFVTYLSAIGVF